MIKNKFFAVVFLSMVLMLFTSGCSFIEMIVAADGHVEVITAEASHGVYQMNLDETRIVKVPYEVEATTLSELIEGCIFALEQKPSDNA